MKKIFYGILVMSIAFVSVVCGNNKTAATAQNDLVASQHEDSKDDSKVEPTGMIAYIRNGSEIRLIDSNGQNDRQPCVRITGAG